MGIQAYLHFQEMTPTTSVVSFHLQVVSKHWLGSAYSLKFLSSYLNSLYQILVLLHGPLQNCIDQVRIYECARWVLLAASIQVARFWDLCQGVQGLLFPISLLWCCSCQPPFVRLSYNSWHMRYTSACRTLDVMRSADYCSLCLRRCVLSAASRALIFLRHGLCTEGQNTQ